MQLIYTNLPPRSRVSYEPLADGLRVAFPGWCQGRTAWQIAWGRLWLVAPVAGSLLAWAVIWALIMHRLFPTMPLAAAMLGLVRGLPDAAMGSLMPIAALFVVPLLFGCTRTVVELDGETLTVTTHLFHWQSREELPRVAIAEVRYRWGPLKIRAKKGVAKHTHGPRHQC